MQEVLEKYVFVQTQFQLVLVKISVTLLITPGFSTELIDNRLHIHGCDRL